MKCHGFLFLWFFAPLLFLALTAQESRIVSLSPALTELVVQLGAEKELVGRSTACDYPERIKQLPAAGDFAKPNPEQTALLRPTLLLSNDLIDPQMKKQLEALGIEVIIKQCHDVESYREWVRLLGKKLHREEEAAQELLRIEKILAELEEKKNAIPLEQRKLGIWVIWDTPLMLAGKGSLADCVITVAGGTNMAGNLSLAYPKVSSEWLFRNDPDFIVWPDIPPEKLKRLRQDSSWKELRAVRNNALLHTIPPELLLRPGPRMFEGMKQLQKELDTISR